MYGIGGTEICIEQKLNNIFVDKYCLADFTMQLGDVKDKHGCYCIVGSDFFSVNKIVIDFEKLEVKTN